jgi:hypothetical protein
VASPSAVRVFTPTLHHQFEPTDKRDMEPIGFRECLRERPETGKVPAGLAETFR